MTEGNSIINAQLTPLPDKVGVDGLEDKWRAVWDEDGTYKFRNTRDRKASTPSTPRRPPFPVRCTWVTCSPTRTPT